jgi:hypothetical protein
MTLILPFELDRCTESKYSTPWTIWEPPVTPPPDQYHLCTYVPSKYSTYNNTVQYYVRDDGGARFSMTSQPE